MAVYHCIRWITSSGDGMPSSFSLYARVHIIYNIYYTHIRVHIIRVHTHTRTRAHNTRIIMHTRPYARDRLVKILTSDPKKRAGTDFLRSVVFLYTPPAINRRKHEKNALSTHPNHLPRVNIRAPSRDYGIPPISRYIIIRALYFSTIFLARPVPILRAQCIYYI